MSKNDRICNPGNNSLNTRSIRMANAGCDDFYQDFGSLGSCQFGFLNGKTAFFFCNCSFYFHKCTFLLLGFTKRLIYALTNAPGITRQRVLLSWKPPISVR